MYTLETKIDVNSDEFKWNKEEYQKLLAKYREVTKNAMSSGSEKARMKHKERGKHLARERINLLVDANTPFLELSTLAANDEI